MAMWGVGVMVGPILGPTLGGYLTEVYNWRWVFYINLPFGLLALLGILSFVPETARDRGRPLDWFGFTLLSLAIGTLQLMLDRGQSQDWFTSSEIIIESVLSALFLYLFVVHMLTHRRPFLEPGLFRDRNFSIGLVFIFVVGIILLATLALLPPFLQNLMGYPVVTTGFVLAPRGVGTMFAMLLVGRLSGKVDPRAMILAGLCLTAVSLWEMSQFTLQVDAWSIVRTGVTQGLGLGFIFVPLSTITFATLRPQWRNEGTAMFSLMRNIGSSIGISVMVTLLARNTQANHALLSDQLTPFNSALQAAGHAWAPDTLAGMLALNSEVTRQAAAIAYLSDFRMMMWVTLLALPLLALLRKPSHPVAVEPG
jgi:DHA2 family multidrug resistance protein